MFDFKCLFCNESMPFATKRGYHKTCVRAMREIEVPTFTIDTAWKLEVVTDVEEDTTTIDLGAESTYGLSEEISAEDPWDAKTELIKFVPEEIEEDTEPKWTITSCPFNCGECWDCKGYHGDENPLYCHE